VALPGGGLHENLYLLQMRDFVQWLGSVRAGGGAPLGAAQGLGAPEIVLAAYRSAELHAPMLVDRQD